MTEDPAGSTDVKERERPQGTDSQDDVTYVKKASNPTAIASLVLGIIAVLSGVFGGWIPLAGLVFTFGWAAAAAITGYIAKRKAEREPVGGRTAALWGIGLAIAGFVVSVIWFVVLSMAAAGNGTAT